jgi:outer membrane lipoprotein-sorting protein
MLRKLLPLALACLWVLGAAAAGAAEFSGDLVMETGGQKITGKIYVKGDKQRLEMETPGGAMVNILDVPSRKVFVLMPAMKMYMVQELGPETGLTTLELGSKDLPPGAKKMGTETIAGYVCDVYEVDSPQSGKGKVWLSRELRFPLKATGRGPGGKSTMTLSNITEGGVDASRFQVPPGYQQMQMPKGMKPGAPGMPGGAGN